MRIIARLNVGGPAIQVLTLTRELNNSRFESLLLHGSVGKNEADMSTYTGMDVSNKLLLPEMGRDLHPVKDIITLFKTIAVIRREKPRIVHTHTAKAGAVGRMAAILCGVPVIIHTYHGHVFHGYFSPLKTALFKAIEKFLAAFTTRIITISPLQKKEISGILKIPESRITVIPLGFRLERFSGAAEKYRGEFRKSVGAPANVPIVSIVGRITGIKNHGLFLESAKLILKKRPDAVFAIVGDGEDRAKCEETSVRLGISDRVIFAGWREEVEKVYADTAVTAVTSLNEGTPVCLIESLSAGTPVVATNVGGVADVVRDGETGFLCESGDARAVAERILMLLDDSALREKMGRAGEADMLARYTQKRLVSDIAALYESLIKDNN